MQPYKILIISIIVSPFIFYSCSGCKSSPCRDKNCEDYTYQEDAQLDYDLYRSCRNDLDADKDGIACEHLPSKPTNTGGNNTGGGNNSGCPTTANCGCSNKKKADCPSACCKWVVGDGCKCA